MFLPVMDLRCSILIPCDLEIQFNVHSPVPFNTVSRPFSLDQVIGTFYIQINTHVIGDRQMMIDITEKYQYVCIPTELFS